MNGIISTQDQSAGQVVKVKGQEDYEALIERFLETQDVKDSTRETYRWSIRKFFDWVRKGRMDLRSLSAADIVRYKATLLKEKLSPETVGLYLTAVHLFYRWTEMNLIFPDISRSVRSPHVRGGVKKMHLTEEEVEQLLDYLKGRSLRDYAMVNLIIRTGLRTVEVSRADVRDVTLKKGHTILRIWGKGRDDRSSFVMLNPPVLEPLQGYLATREGLSADSPLFVTDGKGHRGNRMSPRLVQHVCKEALRAIGLDAHEYSAHSLRHTTAVHILKKGGDWKDVQRVLRHLSPATSQIYTESIEEEIRLEKNPESLLDDAFGEDNV